MTGKASPLQPLARLGQSLGYDDIHRRLIDSGGLARMVHEDGLTGVTSNPAIFEKAVTGSDNYDTLLFAVERYREVLEAYLRGLGARAEADHRLDDLASATVPGTLD